MVKNILWDFDGVILDSMDIRDSGFEKIFSEFDESKTKLLLEYHRLNGGLSRYVKIRYFFESILKQSITEPEVFKYASRFSDVMRKELVLRERLILDAVTYIKNNYEDYNFHIVSGSDQEELRFLCNELGLTNYFISIQGSPTPKNTLVKDLLENYGYLPAQTCLIGDSINDYEAARSNDISFYGYNSKILKTKVETYIESFDTFII